jgi:hypothetical protein
MEGEIESIETQIKLLNQQKIKLKGKMRYEELQRIKCPEWNKEIESYKQSNFSGFMGCFKIDDIEFHFQSNSDSLRVSFIQNIMAYDFTIDKNDIVISKYDLGWDKMSRVIAFAKFLRANLNFEKFK